MVMEAEDMRKRPASNADERRDEKRLIARARRGESVALRELIDLHKDRLFAFVRRMIRNHHDAEEIVQDAFLKAFASLDSFSTDYRFSTWLFTIGYRLCLNAIRRRHALTGELDFATVADSGADAQQLVAESDQAKHLRNVVWNAVERLSDAQKATVILFYRQEQSCQDIAQVLELPVATVKSHLHRARARLREILQPVVTDETSRLRILAGLAG